MNTQHGMHAIQTSAPIVVPANAAATLWIGPNSKRPIDEHMFYMLVTGYMKQQGSKLHFSRNDTNTLFDLARALGFQICEHGNAQGVTIAGIAAYLAAQPEQAGALKLVQPFIDGSMLHYHVG